MSNYSTDCIPNIPLAPDLTLITQCQASAKTPFCWPPNNTRICVPSDDIPFYWPRSYYDASSRLEIEYDLNTSFFILLNNTGNRTQDFTASMYDRKGVAIPGKKDEKVMKMYMRERRFGEGVSDKSNMQIHDGPTLTLVKTAAFSPTTVRASASATSTRRPYSPSSSSSKSKNRRKKLPMGAVVGIALGSFLGLLLIFIAATMLCCPPKGRRKAKPTLGKDETSRIVEEGVALMEQKGGGAAVSEREVSRETARDGRGAVGGYTPL